MGRVLLGIIICDQGNEFAYCLCKKDDNIGLHKLWFNDNIGYHKNGLWYTKITLQDSLTEIDSTKDLDLYEFDYCIGIPELHSNYEQDIYNFFSKNWTCRQQRGTFMSPKIFPKIMDYHN